jgi:ribosomal protein S18 acetylase RimI-like enzyme
METVRIAGPGDEQRLLAFLETHPDTTLFMQSNLAAGGVEDRGERFQATYACAFDGAAIVGVAAHCWNGMLLVQAPVAREAVLRAACEASGRGVGGFAGATSEVEAAKASLGLRDAPVLMDSAEVLYRLRLEALRVPEALSTGPVRARRSQVSDLPVLRPWSLDYRVEAISEDAGAQVAADVEASLRAGLEGRTVWIAEVEAVPVAMTRFNATTPVSVQVGGVYTPPALRSRGYAACVVAQSLLDARAEGATRSILFTPEDNLPAQRCYERLGYGAIGSYGLVLLREAHIVP